MSNPLWTLEEGLEVARIFETELSQIGFHVAVTGGVLLNGYSSKDLDLIVYPHDASKCFFDRAKIRLEIFFGVKWLPAIQSSITNPRDPKIVWVGEYNGKRIDVFFLK